MNKYTFCFLAAGLMLCIFSCKKDKQATASTGTTKIDSPVVVTYPDYTALKAGNYWIYQDYKLDSVNGAAHALGTFDSLFVDKDTVINGDTFHKYWDVAYGTSSSNPSYNISYLRDSLSYTVTPGGGIIFSSEDFKTIFHTESVYNPLAGITDTITVTFQMGFKDSSVTVDAGTYVTSSYRQIFYMPPPVYQYGPTREYDHRYAKNIGLVSYTTGFYTSLPVIYERRLVRYRVQ